MFRAVAAYSGASDAKTAEIFADDVYSVLSEGTARTTNAGQAWFLVAVAIAVLPALVLLAVRHLPLSSPFPSRS